MTKPLDQKITQYFDNNTKDIKYVAYVRKSTEEADRQAMSIDAQIEAIKKQFPNLKITFIKESMSAAKPGRTLFNKMMEEIETNKYQGIIAWHPDRLSRNAPDASRIVWDIQQGQIKDLRFCNFTFEPTPEGIMMLQMIMSQAQYFSAKLSKDVKRGNAQKRKNGGITYCAPTGYINNKLTKEIEPDPERFPLMQKAFRLMLTGSYSVAEIAHIMREDWGYNTLKRARSGGKPISNNAVYKAFRNPLYAGIIVDPYTGEHFQGKHKAMITEEEHKEILKLTSRKGMPQGTPRNKEFPLRGFIKCGNCGCMITAEERRKHQKNGNTHIYRYYRCTHKSKTKCCHQPAIREEALWEQLEKIIDQYEITPKLYELGMKALKEIADKELKERDSVQDNQTTAIRTTQKQLDRLLDLLTDNIITTEDYTKKSAELKQRLTALQEKQSETALRSRNWYEIVGSTLTQLTTATKRFNNGTLEDKKQILFALGSNPILTDGRLSLEEYFWLQPIKKTKQVLIEKLEEVRTTPQQMKNTSEEAVYHHWCRYRESDPDLILGKDA